MALTALLSGKNIQFVIMYLLVSCECRSEEVYCSKFPYEEALLEKMVRMEFNMKTMNEDYKAKQEQIEQDLINVKLRVQTTHTELQTKLSTELQTRFNKDIVQDFKKLRLENENENEGIRDVLFRATGVADASPAKDQIIVFEELQENIGTAYNNTSGVFTAPTNGQYFFSVQFCGTRDKRDGDATKNLHFAFVEDRVVKKPFSFFFGYYTCVSTTFITRLNAGACVWIKNFLDLSKITVVNNNSYLTNEFSGILV